MGRVSKLPPAGQRLAAPAVLLSFGPRRPYEATCVVCVALLKSMRMRGLEPPLGFPDTDLNRIRGRQICPWASRSSVLSGFADASDASDDMTVATVLPRGGKHEVGTLWDSTFIRASVHSADPHRVLDDGHEGNPTHIANMWVLFPP